MLLLTHDDVIPVTPFVPVNFPPTFLAPQYLLTPGSVGNGGSGGNVILNEELF